MGDCLSADNIVAPVTAVNDDVPVRNLTTAAPART